MIETTPQDLVELLARQELRIRTGILELPIEFLGREDDLAVGLNVGHRDICTWMADRVPAERTRLGLQWEAISKNISLILADLSVPGYCVWVSSADVLLARIPHADRERFWQYMWGTFRPSRGLLLSMPVGAKHLLSDSERKCWSEYGRLSVWANIDW